jgi:hypothetical protein
MEQELLTKILEELHEIRKDLHWFREREEQKVTAAREETASLLAEIGGRTGRTRP